MPFLKSLLLLLIFCTWQIHATSEGSNDSSTEADSTSAETTEQATKKLTKKVAPPPKVNPPKAREFYFNRDARNFFNPDQLKTLLAGDTEFYALLQEDMTGRARGVALLIPDWGQTAVSSRGIEYLRTTLPDYGWVTLSMAVPNAHDPVFVTGIDGLDTASTDTSVNMSKAEPLRFIDEIYMADYELHFKLRMLALIEEANNYQGYFIVIAQGSSAAVLASLYAKSALPEPEAMILLSANMPDMQLTQKMNIDIAQNSVPTLDIYQSRGLRWAEKNLKLRKKLARKYFKVAYRQKELYGDISYHNQNQRLIRTIYGWLSSLGL